MRENMQVGDEVITIGGIVGRIEKITDKTVVISTGAAKNKIEFLKTAISSVSTTENSKPAPKKAEPEVEEEKAPNRDKKVTPKKLGKKSDDAE
jgi:preprotein translocase subunit YajC